MSSSCSASTKNIRANGEGTQVTLGYADRQQLLGV
jgi:hypothetical protein